MELHNYVGRNIIAYYSGFLSKPKIEGIEINDEDKNGFMLCIHKMEREKGLDLILHTPGGDVAATESLVHYLKKMFGNDIRAFVPQIAMSAGTMIACACREIYMGQHSNIGPVDPQFNGIPALGVIEEIERAYKEIVADPRRAAVWSPILSRYPPSFVQVCHWAIERAKDFVTVSLKENMFSDLNDRQKEEAVRKVSEWLSDLSKNKGHDKHFHFDDCEKIGLRVVPLESDKKLQDLVLTVHHCYMHTLSNTNAHKIIENHVGRAFVKLQQTAPQIMLLQQPPGVAPTTSIPTDSPEKG